MSLSVAPYTGDKLAHSHGERDDPVWGALHRTVDKTESDDTGGLEVRKALLIVWMRGVAGEGSDFGREG